jgi:AbrB family looped-hinge helix DNA binding protein
MDKRGQITIPVQLRKKLRLKPGSVISMSEKNGRLAVIAFRRLLSEIQGSLKPRSGEPSMFEEFFAERERERRGEKT